MQLRKSPGFSLVELMIGAGISMIVLLSGIAILTITNREIAIVNTVAEFDDNVKSLNSVFSNPQSCKSTLFGLDLPVPTGSPSHTNPFQIPPINQPVISEVFKDSKFGARSVLKSGTKIGKININRMHINDIIGFVQILDPDGVPISQTVLLDFQVQGSYVLMGQTMTLKKKIPVLVARDPASGKISDCLDNLNLNRVKNILTCPQLQDGSPIDPKKTFVMTGFEADGTPICREITLPVSADPTTIVDNATKSTNCRTASGIDPGQYIGGIDGSGNLICLEFPQRPTPNNCHVVTKYSHYPRYCSNTNGDMCATPFVPATDNPLPGGIWSYGSCHIGCDSGQSFCYDTPTGCPATGLGQPPQGTFNYASARISGVHEACLSCDPRNDIITYIECN